MTRASDLSTASFLLALGTARLPLDNCILVLTICNPKGMKRLAYDESRESMYFMTDSVKS